MSVSIYGLIDPRTSEVRYVGKTIKPLAYRLSAHLCPSELAQGSHKASAEQAAHTANAKARRAESQALKARGVTA
jgi:hypothetical protein